MTPVGAAVVVGFMTWAQAVAYAGSAPDIFPARQLRQSTAVPAVTIRLTGEPRWRRARNETTVVLGGDVRVQASYVVADLDGRPRGGVPLVVYARGDGPLAKASSVSDDRGVASGNMFFQIDPGLVVTLQACLQNDPGVCSPQRTLSLRQRLVISTDVTSTYGLAPNLRPASADQVSFCERVKDCEPFLQLYSATASNQLDVAALTTASLTLRETTGSGQRNHWSVFAALPVSVQRSWASTYFGNQFADTAIAPGDFSFGTRIVRKVGYIQGIFDGRTPKATGTIDRLVNDPGAGSANSYADGASSIDIEGQVNASLGPTRYFYAAASVSRAFDRRFERAMIDDRLVANVTARRGLQGQASVGLGFAPGGQTFALTPWMGISVQDATRVAATGLPKTISPASTNVLAGFRYVDLRGGPLATTLGTTVSGLAGKQLVVSFFVSVNIRELFVIR